jgi:hypothetical protein
MLICHQIIRKPFGSVGQPSGMRGSIGCTLLFTNDESSILPLMNMDARCDKYSV